MDSKLIVLSGLLAITQAVPLTSFGIESRIAGGQDAKEGEFPYLVSLAWEMPQIPKSDHFCSGAIINESWILTTANCLYFAPSTDPITVKAGKHRLEVHEPNEQVALIEKRILHEDFELQSASNNIALLKLKWPLKLNANVAAIKLPQANSGVTGSVTIAGWGITSTTSEMVYPKVLQKLNLTLSNIRDCQKSYENINVKFVSTENNLCTTSPPDASPCLGDIGAPVITNEPGKPREVVGLVSWVMHPCSFLSLPHIHVKVSSYVNWIQNKIDNESFY